jgi:nucleotide-binding universal stress UspA family protein
MIIAPDDHCRLAGAMRVLLAVHGGEASGWGLEARRILATWSAPSVRVLAVVVPRRSFRSLLPAAARRYRDALEAWVESERLRRLVEGLLPMLPGVPEVAWVRAAQGDPGRTIAESAVTWSADVVLVGAAAAPGLWLSAVHERLIRHASCPVLVTPVALVGGRRARVPSLTATRARRRLGRLAGQEA